MLPSPPGLANDADLDDRPHRRSLWRRLVVAVVLGVPVLLMSMIPALQFRGWQWVALAARHPGGHVGGVAVPPRRVEEPPPGGGEHGHAGLGGRDGRLRLERCTRCLLTAAGDVGMTMPMSLVPTRGDTHHLYFEVASTTVALILAGRWFEARAKRRAGGALRALLALGADTANVSSPTAAT